MCVQDMWIARHLLYNTYTESTNAAGLLRIPARSGRHSVTVWGLPLIWIRVGYHNGVSIFPVKSLEFVNTASPVIAAWHSGITLLASEHGQLVSGELYVLASEQTSIVVTEVYPDDLLTFAILKEGKKHGK